MGAPLDFKARRKAATSTAYNAQTQASPDCDLDRTVGISIPGAAIASTSSADRLKSISSMWSNTTIDQSASLATMLSSSYWIVEHRQVVEHLIDLIFGITAGSNNQGADQKFGP